MSNDLQVTMFLRPDTTIRTVDRPDSAHPEFRIVLVHIGDVAMHLPSDDLALADTADRLIVALMKLRNAALLRLPEPPEPKWLHEMWVEPELREAFGR